MKFFLNNEQRQFFQKEHFLFLGKILNHEELETLNQGITTVLASPLDNYFSLRDLWRKNSAIKKIITSRRLVELAYEFMQQKPFRLAFDQLLPEKTNLFIKEKRFTFHETLNFQETSCITNLLGLFLICLKEDPNLEDSFLKVGEAIFILPDVTFPFLTYTPSFSKRYLLIGYSDLYSQYRLEPHDLHCHDLKSLGYVFGDRLKDNLHPLLMQ